MGVCARLSRLIFHNGSLKVLSRHPPAPPGWRPQPPPHDTTRLEHNLR